MAYRKVEAIRYDELFSGKDRGGTGGRLEEAGELPTRRAESGHWNQLRVASAPDEEGAVP